LCSNHFRGQANNQKIQDLAGDEGSKVAQNVAAGVVGLFVWPVWFAMDFQGAAGKDVAALQSRQQYLAILAEQRNCAASPVAPATIPTPVATLPPAAVTASAAPAATPISTAATPAPTAGAWPNIIPALSPPAPAATAAPAMPGATFDTNSYEEGQQQYRQAEQEYQRQLELQRAQGR
jgi:hypothetical protein